MSNLLALLDKLEKEVKKTNRAKGHMGLLDAIKQQEKDDLEVIEQEKKSDIIAP